MPLPRWKGGHESEHSAGVEVDAACSETTEWNTAAGGIICAEDQSPYLAAETVRIESQPFARWNSGCE
jgi:hypothetical protein